MSHAQMPLTFSEDEVTQGPLQGSLTQNHCISLPDYALESERSCYGPINIV